MKSNAHPHLDSHRRPHHHSRRDFFQTMFDTALAGAGVLEIAASRALWAQVLSREAPAARFEISRVAENVYFALARPFAMTNSNAAIFVNTENVIVVDAHSHPAAVFASHPLTRRGTIPASSSHRSLTRSISRDTWCSRAKTR